MYFRCSRSSQDPDVDDGLTRLWLVWHEPSNSWAAFDAPLAAVGHGAVPAADLYEWIYSSSDDVTAQGRHLWKMHQKGNEPHYFRTYYPERVV